MDAKEAMHANLLPDEDVARLVASAARHAEGGISEQDARHIYDWAFEARLQALMVDMVIRGDIVLTGVRDGEPVFGLPE